MSEDIRNLSRAEISNLSRSEIINIIYENCNIETSTCGEQRVYIKNCILTVTRRDGRWIRWVKLNQTSPNLIRVSSTATIELQTLGNKVNWIYEGELSRIDNIVISTTTEDKCRNLILIFQELIVKCGSNIFHAITGF